MSTIPEVGWRVLASWVDQDDLPEGETPYGEITVVDYDSFEVEFDDGYVESYPLTSDWDEWWKVLDE